MTLLQLHHCVDAPMMYNRLMIIVETRLFTSRIFDAMRVADAYAGKSMEEIAERYKHG